MALRVGYVREHFSTPLLQYQEVDQDKTFTLVECPSGTGQLISRLTKDEIDLTGSTAYKLCGSYVSTPLNWAVITGKDTKFENISDLKGTTIGISRNGSGSQTMAYVMALQQGWPTDDLKFQINNDIHGLINSVNDGSTSAFMWEWFTTKPWVDKGEARFIGSVPTPWPSWLIAAHPSPSRAPPDTLRVIKDKFGYPLEDIEAWLKTVAYPQDCSEIPRKVITDTLSVLEKAGVVKAPEGGFDVGHFVASDIVKLT
ncbi:hypothetical protein C8J57DRAFT_1290493 [Mycena rebaudengoi]|nr:hypothetical protein C8J57DRAFT_1290493 [Mycena rebaudengoi]